MPGTPRAYFHWEPRFDADRKARHRDQLICPARFDTEPPPWTDGTWTVQCDFSMPINEQGNPAHGFIDFKMPNAPRDRLTHGVYLYLYQGSELIGRAELWDPPDPS